MLLPAAVQLASSDQILRMNSASTQLKPQGTKLRQRENNKSVPESGPTVPVGGPECYSREQPIGSFTIEYASNKYGDKQKISHDTWFVKNYNSESSVTSPSGLTGGEQQGLGDSEWMEEVG